MRTGNDIGSMVVAMHVAGKTNRQIRLATGWGEDAIASMLRDHGIVRRRIWSDGEKASIELARDAEEAVNLYRAAFGDARRKTAVQRQFLTMRTARIAKERVKELAGAEE